MDKSVYGCLMGSTKHWTPEVHMRAQEAARAMTKFCAMGAEGEGPKVLRALVRKIDLYRARQDFETLPRKHDGRVIFEDKDWMY